MKPPSLATKAKRVSSILEKELPKGWRVVPGYLTLDAKDRIINCGTNRLMVAMSALNIKRRSCKHA